MSFKINNITDEINIHDNEPLITYDKYNGIAISRYLTHNPEITYFKINIEIIQNIINFGN